MCSSYQNCSDHASAAVLTADGQCVCTCRKGWSGDACDTCPAEFVESNDCGSCSVGYPGTGYPNCEACSVPANCSGSAYRVNGDHSVGCTCNCFQNTSGLTCATQTASLSPTHSLPQTRSSTASDTPSPTHSSTLSVGTPSHSATPSASRGPRSNWRAKQTRSGKRWEGGKRMA